MARILICHVPKDGSTARELGAALMGRGHFVSFDGEPDTPRDDRSQRLRQFEAVIVVWTDVSAPSTGLEAIAREALPLNLLTPVRAEELEKTRLPLQFRKLNMFAPRDVDGIARLIARLSTAASSRREMAAAPPVQFERREKPKSPEQSAAPVAPARGAEAQPKEMRAVTPQAAAMVQASEPKSLVAPELSAPHERTQPSRPVSPPPVSSPQAPVASVPPSAGPSPNMHAAIPPVFESHAAVKARPLFDLPEVAPTFPQAQISPPPVEEPAKPSRAAELHNALNPGPSRDQRPAVTAADLSRAVDDGLLVWRIPDAMWLGEPITVEIALNHPHLAGLFPADTVNTGHQALRRQSIETLSVSLYGHTDVFEIERQSERTQFVIPKQTQPGRDPSAIGRWLWLVTPQSAGVQDLVVRISVLLRDRNGVPEPVALPDRRFEIAIGVPEGVDLVSGLTGWHRA